MKRIAIITACFSALLMMSFVITKEDRLYKNLKVLPKNTTKKEMDSVMRHFAQSLGVKCNFCHQFNQEQKAMDFASDANEHKGVAREMMKMTARLNKKYFDVKDSKSLTAKLEVTCYTCHHGKEEPTTMAPPPPPRAAGDSARRPATDTARRQ
jgi:CRISPR/Cas system-associated protein Cas10 (large subunit of type III CRISPR-Cas system)